MRAGMDQTPGLALEDAAPAAPPTDGGRLADLETELRRTRRLATWSLVVASVVFGLSVAIVFMMGRRAAPGMVAEVIDAHRFILRGPGGEVRAMLALSEDGAARLTLNDADGHARSSLSLLADGSPGLVFSDADGRARIVLGVLPDQTSTLAVADARGRTRTVVGVTAAGGSTVALADEAGRTRAGLGVAGDGRASFTLAEPSGGSPATHSEADPATSDP